MKNGSNAIGASRTGGVDAYADRLTREATIRGLLLEASREKSGIEAYWRKMRRYYDGDHDIRAEAAAFTEEKDIPWEAAQSPDGYIHVESQIDIRVPDFEFSPRGNDDYERARQREAITRFICEANRLEEMNAVNERRLNVLGTAVYKVCWDENAFDGRRRGEVMIDNPHPKEIYADPTALSVDGCEYIGYVYTMHRAKARRVFADDVARIGGDIEEYLASGRASLRPGSRPGSRLESRLGAHGETGSGDDTVCVTEWWFRQPRDGHERVTLHVNGREETVEYTYKAGDIALSVLLGDREVRYLPKYWNNTVCDLFPFVIYTKIPSDGSLWGKSEIEAILPLIDASDRELSFAQMNSAFSSNDIIMAEENALADDGELDNSPGAVWKLRPGMMGKIQRLGNGAYAETNQYNNCSYWRRLMQETAGNFEINQGMEPSKVTSASGIAYLGERSKSRQAMKKVIKAEGFRRLYELCDRTALEHYPDGRVVELGAADGENAVFRFGWHVVGHDELDRAYTPLIDVKIHIGDGVSNSKALTLQALSELMRVPMNEDNYLLVESYAELVGLPMRQKIIDHLERRFGAASKGLPAPEMEMLPTGVGDAVGRMPRPAEMLAGEAERASGKGETL